MLYHLVFQIIVLNPTPPLTPSLIPMNILGKVLRTQLHTLHRICKSCGVQIPPLRYSYCRWFPHMQTRMRVWDDDNNRNHHGTSINECWGWVFNGGGRRKRLENGGGIMEGISSRRGRGHLHDNIDWLELAFGSSFLYLWMIVFYLFEWFLVILWCCNDE